MYLIIPSEQTVIVDGEKRKFDFTLDGNIEAVRWDETREKAKGRIEMKVGLDETFDDPAQFQDILDQHAAILEQEAQDAEAAEEEYNLLENVTKREILALEKQITPRRMREAMLTVEGEEWLSGIEAQIEELRGQL